MVDQVINFFGFEIIIPVEFKQLLIAAIIGFIIGIDRAIREKIASLRTFSMISTGSCLFTILSIKSTGAAESHVDVSRIAAQIVTGIGFLGGGVIFKTTDRVEGLTTAAMIWLTAALGMCCGYNQIGLVVWAFGLGAFIHLLSTWAHKAIDFINRKKKSSSEQLEDSGMA